MHWAFVLSRSPCIQNADSQGPKLFFLGSLAVAVGSASFFPSPPSSSHVPPNPKHFIQYIPSRDRCCWDRSATIPQSASACFFCSLRIPLARSSGHRDQHKPCYLGCIRRYLNTQGNESLSVHPNCAFQGSLGSTRLGPPNSSQTVSVSSPQSRSSSSAFSSSGSPSLGLSICLPKPGDYYYLSLSGSPQDPAPLLSPSIPSEPRVDSLAVALILEPTPPKSVSFPSPRHPIPPSPLFRQPGFGEKQARQTRRYPFLEALYSCHLDTFLYQATRSEPAPTRQGEKKGSPKTKIPSTAPSDLP